MTNTEFNDFFFPNITNDNINLIAQRVRMYPIGYYHETYYNTTKTETIIDRPVNKQFQSLVNNYLLTIECLIPETMNICDKYEYNINTKNIDNDIYVAKTSSMSDAIFHGGFLYVIPFNNCQNTLIELRKLLNKQFPSTATVIALKKCDNCGYLSYAYDQNVCMIEIYPPICSEDRLNIGKEFEQNILLKYGGSIHWSKQLISINEMNNITYANSITNFYSKFNEFDNLRKIADPNNIFLNDYLAKIFNSKNDVNIEYPLIDEYRKNSRAWEMSGWCSIIISSITTK